MTCPWAPLYIERWLTVPMLQEDGTTSERNRGTPQRAWSARCLPTSSCIAHSTDGWHGRFSTQRGRQECRESRICGTVSFRACAHKCVLDQSSAGVRSPSPACCRAVQARYGRVNPARTSMRPAPCRNAALQPAINRRQARIALPQGGGLTVPPMA